MKKDDTSETIEQFHNYLFKSINRYKKNYGNIVEMLTLDNDFDNPDAVLQAADAVAMLYAYYATLFHKANKRQQHIETAYKLWKSKIDAKIKILLFVKNKNNGMTSNNAKPTQSDVENYFNNHYTEKEEYIKWQNKINKISEIVSQLRIMRDTIDRRQQSIQIISNLLGKCIDKGFIVITSKKTKKFRRKP